MTDVPTTPRKPLTPAQRLNLFEDHGGKCVLCGLKIRAGERWIDEHIRALGLGGTNDPENRGPAHEKCAEVKTHDEDMPRIVKAKRIKRKHLGIKSRKSRPMLGSKASGWKKPFNGPAERRTER